MEEILMCDFWYSKKQRTLNYNSFYPRKRKMTIHGKEFTEYFKSTGKSKGTFHDSIYLGTFPFNDIIIT